MLAWYVGRVPKKPRGSCKRRMLAWYAGPLACKPDSAIQV